MKTSSKKATLNIILTSFSLIAFAFYSLNMKAQTTNGDDGRSLIKQFSDPPKEYRTTPFMVWDAKVTHESIDRQLRNFKESGAGGAIIHPRPGLITEYLSNEWFELYDYAVSQAKKLGLDIWMYDENSYPSGFAGGHVNAEMPSSYNQGTGMEGFKFTQLPDDAKEYFVILKKEGSIWKDISKSFNSYKNKNGDYYLFKKVYNVLNNPWHGGFCYVDLMAPGVTEKFLEITMKGYENTFGDKLAESIHGMFSDEPQIHSIGRSFRWTPLLFQTYQKRWGESLIPLLPYLYEETGPWKEVRNHYRQVLLQLFIERWSIPMHDYCEKHGLKWTGHYWEHAWPDVGEGPDNMAMYPWHQMPAIDMLFNQFNETHPQAQFGNVRSVKELRSVANQMGYKRTLSETYGGGGWDERFVDFKRLGDWEYVLGVNFMNQHLAHQTLQGARKMDYPPEFDYYSPWWKDYKTLNDYFGRLSMALSTGDQKNDLLIIEPTSTIWCYQSEAAGWVYNTSKDPLRMPMADKIFALGTDFQTFITTLEKNQIEYDLGSEDIMMRHGSINGKKMVVGKASYSTVILPPKMENLSASTFNLLKQFVAVGGHLICFSSPNLIDGKLDTKLVEFMKSPSITHVNALTKDVEQKYFANNRPKMDFNGGNLFHQRRILSDGTLLFLVNSSMEEESFGTLAEVGESVIEMDAKTGQIFTYPSENANEKKQISFRIAPAGSLMLFFSKEKTKYAFRPAQAGNFIMPASSETVVKRMEDNVLTLEFCDLTIGNTTKKELYYPLAADEAFKANGFTSGDPWNKAIQYKRNIVDRDTFTAGGFKAIYHFNIKDTFDFSNIKIVTEQPQIFKVRINGTVVKAAPGEWWLDESFGVFHVGSLIHLGDNTIQLEAYPMSLYAEIAPVYVLGDFAVNAEMKGWSIGAPPKRAFTFGSWKSQQHPFYSRDFSYTKSYNIEKVDGAYAVKLGKWNGTVAEVFVNGTKAGVIFALPYRLDVTKFIKTGSNTVEVRVTGSNKNLLGPHLKDPDGIAGPFSWENNNTEVSGASYPMRDYGLIDDFSLIN